LSLSKGSYYYQPAEESTENQEIMKEIDKEHIEHPTKGVVGMVDHLFALGFIVGPKRIRRLMRLMRIIAYTPKKSLSKPGPTKYRMPYLLKNLKIDHSNKVWSIDITYIPMKQGFMYLTAVIDVFSRCIMAWGLHNSLDAANSIEVLHKAVEEHGLPEIINSDQGSQYTSEAWVKTCSEYGITISMDGKGRCKDNIWIERFWRTIKYDYVYLNPTDDAASLRTGIKTYMEYYNCRRAHQGINHQIPLLYYNEHKLSA
jgi:putative transposase